MVWLHLIKLALSTDAGWISAPPATDFSPLPAPQITYLQLKQNRTELSCLMLHACAKQKRTGGVTTLNEIVYNLISAFISEICFTLLPFKAGHSVFHSALSSV
jgi:hypothetical protein